MKHTNGTNHRIRSSARKLSVTLRSLEDSSLAISPHGRHSLNLSAELKLNWWQLTAPKVNLHAMDQNEAHIVALSANSMKSSYPVTPELRMLISMKRTQ